MKFKALVVAITLPLMLTGCVQRVADLTIASTKNININSGKFVAGPRVSAEDSRGVFLVPLGSPSVKEATDRAISQDKCSVGLTDVVVESKAFIFLLFGKIGYEVKGTQIIDKGLPGCENHG
ncbi:hypothetical protein VPZ60_004322 [Salmonella enterica]|nr:hypothetical protein [Salmonella enterica]